MERLWERTVDCTVSSGVLALLRILQDGKAMTSGVLRALGLSASVLARQRRAAKVFASGVCGARFGE